MVQTFVHITIRMYIYICLATLVHISNFSECISVCSHNIFLCMYVYTLQVTLNLNAHKTCTCRKLACDTLVAYEIHAKSHILYVRKDTRVLAYTCVYRHVHATSTITDTCMVTISKCLYKK